MEKIYTAKDRAQELGFTSFLDLLENIIKRPIDRTFAEGSVFARVDGGRWLASCDNCSGASYVDPEEDGFYCTGCFNAAHENKLRHVIFPENYKDIESELLKREAKVPVGMFGTQGAAMAQGLPRTWNQDETLEHLAEQREKYADISKDEIMTEYLRVLAELEHLKKIVKGGENGI